MEVDNGADGLPSRCFPLCSRMAHSRSPSLLHDPRLAQVHSFALSYPLPPPGTPAHQMKGPALLSASLIHGICSRRSVDRAQPSAATSSHELTLNSPWLICQ